MNYFVVIISLTLSFLSFGQTSYEFAQTLPPGAESIANMDASLFGDYKNEETATIYRIDAEGISIISIIYSFISREQVRESSKYQVRDGFLFGVVAGDSVPCFLEEDKYYFGIRQKNVVIGAGSATVLTRAGANAYMLNYKETHGYSPSMLTVSGGTLEIRHLEYAPGTKVFYKIKTKNKLKTASPQTIVLQPDEKEWRSIDKALIFGQPIRYVKLKPDAE